jgi:hypothetical protein
VRRRSRRARAPLLPPPQPSILTVTNEPPPDKLRRLRSGTLTALEGSAQEGGTSVSLEAPVRVTKTGLRFRDERVLLADLTSAGDSVVVAAGGAPGIGNKGSSSTFSELKGDILRNHVSGMRGDMHFIELELRVIADVGLVGVAELEAFGRALAGDGAAKLWPKSEGPKGRGALTVGFFLGRDGDARMLADGVQRWREAQARAAEAARPVVVPAAPAAGSASVESTVSFFQQRRAGARPVAAVKEASNG